MGKYNLFVIIRLPILHQFFIYPGPDPIINPTRPDGRLNTRTRLNAAQLQRIAF